MAKRPKIGKVSASSNAIPRAAEPQKSAPKAPSLPLKKWNFSFANWTQIDNFGLNHPELNVTWFASLLERLQSLGEYSIDEVFKDSRLRGFLRFHKIDWSAKNCPLKEEEFFELLPSKSIPQGQNVVQFQISKGKGRVIGYFDHEQIFQIVLLDPMHNLQPSKDFNYSVDPTKVLLPCFSALQQKHLEFLRIAQNECPADGCQTKNSLLEISESPTHARLFCISDLFNEEEVQALVFEHGSIFYALVHIADEHLNKAD